MAVKLNLTGQKYNRLTALEESHRDAHGKVQWKFLCDCGNVITAAGSPVKSGRIKSCGCLHKDNLRERNTTHGRAGTPEHEAWQGMRKRCNNPNATYYENYGGRGITVCPEWDDFSVFHKDMGDRPSSTHSIDRIDNDGNYTAANCRWASREEQANNQRSNLNVEHAGKTQTLKQWSRELGIPYLRMYRQTVTNGLSIKEATQKIKGAI